MECIEVIPNLPFNQINFKLTHKKILINIKLILINFKIFTKLIQFNSKSNSKALIHNESRTKIFLIFLIIIFKIKKKVPIPIQLFSVMFSLRVW